jgi:ParB family chromosome partitioning protein
MTQHLFERRSIALNKLVLHPDNVRAKSQEAYAPDQVAGLAANIQAYGLLQPLLVAPIGKGKFGVLAGGRRLAALQRLASDQAVEEFTPKSEIACRVMPETQNAAVALSFSENALQLPMDALDRVAAFAAMRDKDGADIATIARGFGITERVVCEALRLGSIHPDIRAAHRGGRALA